MNKGKRTFVMNVLRRGTYRWPGRFNSLKKAHKARNAYECNSCKEIFKKKEINLDHKDPVIPVEGTEDFNVIIDRMYAEEGGWQVLCKPCHKTKTEAENEQRVVIKQEKKKSTKKSRKK